MEFLETVMQDVTLKQVFDFIVGAIAVISVVVEFNKKIPFHPITGILSFIGRGINKGLELKFTEKWNELDRKIDELSKQQNTNTEAVNELKVDMERRFNESATEADTKEAKRLRSRIIDFADSCRVHQKHTKTTFENITRDYDDYVHYCEKRNIPNHFIDAEFDYIKDVYSECQEENKFI